MTGSIANAVLSIKVMRVLTRVQRDVGEYLVLIAGIRGYCWPSIPEIMLDLHSESNRTVSSATAALVREGVIRVQRRRRGRNMYYIDPTLYAVPALLPSRENCNEDVQEPSEIDVQPVAHQEAEDVQPVAHQEADRSATSCTPVQTQERKTQAADARAREEGGLPGQTWSGTHWRYPPAQPETNAIAALEAMGTPDPTTGRASAGGFDLAAVTAKACDIARSWDRGSPHPASVRTMGAWLNAGHLPAMIYLLLERAARTRGEHRPPATLAAFASERSWIARELRGGNRRSEARPRRRWDDPAEDSDL